MFKTEVLKKYLILSASNTFKMELEALADKMIDDNHYIIFTKTKELKPEAVIKNEYIEVIGMTAYPKNKIFTLKEDSDFFKKAKFAHLIKINTSKQILKNDVIITKEQAFKLYKKYVKAPSWANKKDQSIQVKNNFESILREHLPSISLGSWLNTLITKHSEYGENKLKKWIDAGYLARETWYGILEIFSPKAFKLETTYKLELPKKENLDTKITPEEKEILKDYDLDLGDSTSFQVPMTNEKIKANIDKMSDDDIAWHLINSKNAMDLGDKNYIRNRLGFKEICILQMMNNEVTKKAKTQIASYLLEKGGVSFASGPTLKTFIITLAKQGKVDPVILEEGKEDELIDKIYYGKITDPDELRKIDYKKYGYQLAHNPHTPTDVLEKIAEYDKKTENKGMTKFIDDPEIGWTGYNPLLLDKKPGEDWDLNFKDLARHPNYPIKKLIDLFRKYQNKYKAAPKAVRGMISTLWQREDLPKEMVDELIQYEDKYNKEYKPEYPPYAMTDQKEILEYWKKSKRKDPDSEYYGDEMIEHPHCPSEILWEVLDHPQTKQRIKKEAYDKLRERNELSDTAVVEKVKKNLKFEAPNDLLKEFGVQAWVAKGDEKLKFTKVSDSELKKLQNEMKAATTHEDFSFEVVDAYTIDRQIHKDYPKMAKEIGNIKYGVYHGTSMANAAGILATGINTKGDSRTGAMFGNGFYLASSASKAAQYASDNFSKTGYGIVFKMDVALGKTAEWKYGRPEHDDIMSNDNEKEQKQIAEYAKKEGFEHASDVPRWHLTHDSVTAKKGLALRHDEYVVKSGQQINITEVILIHKEQK